MHLNRKGVSEGPPAIIYILFTSVMLIFSMVIIFTLMANMDVNGEYNLFNLRYNSIVSRLIYSPKCLATEEAYTGELGQKYQVYPNVIDMAKINKKDPNFKTCFDGISKGKEYDFSLAKLDKTDSVYSLLYYDFGTNKFKDKTDKYCTGNKKWERVGSFMVLINENGEKVPGVLRFCLMSFGELKLDTVEAKQ